MNSQPVSLTLDEFIEEHEAFFQEPYRKAAFLTGCLVQLILQAQRKKLNNEPFLEKLNGLSLDEYDLRKLFPQVIEKMHQYYDSIEKFQGKYVQRLKAEIVPILVDSSVANRTEISFAFVSGLVMQKEFTRYQIKTKGENQEVATESESE